MEATSRTDWARAKVNLTLRVLGRRADGFHELDSLVAFADISDRVEFCPGRTQSVSVTGTFGAAIVGENLASRALALLALLAPQLELGSILIEKVLPIAAGLGGGSADAAATLRLIRRANEGRSDGVDWRALAAQLGSDVPVCLVDAACRMTGRGETLDAVDGLVDLPAVLVNPQVRVPSDKTRQVFKILAAGPLVTEPERMPPVPRDMAGWLDRIGNGCNDLEVPAAVVVPDIGGVLAALRAHPLTRLARLSGAGPTCFGLTASAADAATLAADLGRAHPTWWVRATVLR